MIDVLYECPTESTKVLNVGQDCVWKTTNLIGSNMYFDFISIEIESSPPNIPLCIKLSRHQRCMEAGRVMV